MFWNIFVESIFFAWEAIINNKLRTFLSLLGVTIGIIAIISVFTIVDSLERNIRSNVNSLGENVLYIQKWPWAEEERGDYQWWNYYKRPEVNFKEFRYLNDKSHLINLSAFVFEGEKTIKSTNNILENVNVKAVTYDYANLASLNLNIGRFFTEEEINSGKNYTIIGSNIANSLFGRFNAIGETIKIGGIKTQVIGVLAREGESIIDFTSFDDLVLCSHAFGKQILNIKNSDPLIMVDSKKGISLNQLKAELRNILRGLRTIPPLDQDNFAINQISIATRFLDNLFEVIGLAGWIIGGFSILVGGFGISNIMFVSVKERTRIIGIQKALGAKKYFILIQFLFEAILLCFLGGVLAIFIIFLLVILINSFIDFKLFLSIKNIILGLSVSCIIGVISGLSPAYSASKLDPVEAIRR
ncbi:MAG: ABC transporter permease [Bacteroidota bacterium]|nr:ABC transporter permease [Bacteroidota bacterium]